MELIEEKIVKYCNKYFSTHGQDLEELYLNYQEFHEFTLAMARYNIGLSFIASNSPSGFTVLRYRVGNSYVKIIASKNSMLSDKNALQKLKDRYETKV